MKAGKILLAAAFALTLAASANAGIHVWWETADGTIGAQGQTLSLDCAAGGRCEWDLKMFIGLDETSEFVGGWAEDLVIDSGLAGIVSIKNNSIPGDTPWTTNNGAGVANYGVDIYGNYKILSGAYGVYLGTPTGAKLAALDITLSVNGASGLIDIISMGGGKLWAGSATDGDFFGAMGPLNYDYYGAPYGGEVRGAPAITINVVPEPTTVAFLGLGALALIRRRR